MIRPFGVIEVSRDRWPARKPGAPAPRRVCVVGPYLVQIFPRADGIVRLSVCSTDASRTPSGAVRFADGIAWDDLQEVKRALGYGSLDAVEVYPREHDVVNEANMRHLWVLPQPLTFAWRNS